MRTLDGMKKLHLSGAVSRTQFPFSSLILARPVAIKKKLLHEAGRQQ
jgi:hypothetical protein